MPRRVLKVREVFKALKRHDDKFQIWDNRGKGSHRVINHPDVNGQEVSYPIKCHKLGADVGRRRLQACSPKTTIEIRARTE